MLMILVDNIEEDLKNTTQLKNSLNDTCEVSWNLLCPPGTGSAGKFIVEKPETCSKNKDNPDGCGSLSNDMFSDVTDLINYGKLVRSTESVAKQRHSDPVSVRAGNNEKTPSCSKKTPVKSKCLTVKSGRSTSLDFKNQRGKNPEKSNNLSNVSTLVTYSHSCSLKLSDQVHSIKIPEELKHLLKLFNLYASLQSNSTHNTPLNEQESEQVFSRKCKKSIKSKLLYDLQNTKQSEKYMEYIDISEKAVENKNKSSKLPLVVQYNSKEQLELFESKSHLLFNLQLKSKFLNMIAEYLSKSEDGIIE